jgi:hypothetical protein
MPCSIPLAKSTFPYLFPSSAVPSNILLSTQKVVVEQSFDRLLERAAGENSVSLRLMQAEMAFGEVAVISHHAELPKDYNPETILRNLTQQIGEAFLTVNTLKSRVHISAVALRAHSPIGKALEVSTFNGIYHPFFPFPSSHQVSRASDYISPRKTLPSAYVELKQVLVEVNSTITHIHFLDTAFKQLHSLVINAGGKLSEDLKRERYSWRSYLGLNKHRTQNISRLIDIIDEVHRSGKFALAQITAARGIIIQLYTDVDAVQERLAHALNADSTTDTEIFNFIQAGINTLDTFQ